MPAESREDVDRQPPAQSAVPPKKTEQRSQLRNLVEIIFIFAGAIVVAYLLQAFLVKPFQIPTASMEDTIDIGDRILVNRLSYKVGDIQRGDIIVFQAPTDPGVDYVKRVIALPGDTVEIKRGLVILNGETLFEPYLHDNEDISNFPQQTVPEGMLFMLGDNRRDSEDSRFWKPVPWLPQENVIGKAFMTYWPLDRITVL